jgi:hypothetical protein
MFHSGSPGKDFIRLKSHRATKFLLFLFAALTLLSHDGEINSSDPGSIGSRDLTEQLAPRKNAKAPRSIFVGSSNVRGSRYEDGSMTPRARVASPLIS